jgi:AcrR family transcriptional regulator
MSTTPTTKKDTKTAIMDTAETMMAEHGINGVSIRAILSEAGANSAALHYHFNSKDGLIEEMISRHGRTPTLRRREMIAEFKAKGVSPVPDDIVDFIVDPMIGLLEEKGEGARRFYRFIARLQSDRTGIHRLVEEKYFPEVKKHLRQMLQEACPDVMIDELETRTTMMLDTLLQSLSNAEFMTKEWEDDGHHGELKLFAARLKTFLVGGLAAPAT